MQSLQHFDERRLLIPPTRCQRPAYQETGPQRRHKDHTGQSGSRIYNCVVALEVPGLTEEKKHCGHSEMGEQLRRLLHLCPDSCINLPASLWTERWWKLVYADLNVASSEHPTSCRGVNAPRCRVADSGHAARDDASTHPTIAISVCRACREGVTAQIQIRIPAAIV